MSNLVWIDLETGGLNTDNHDTNINIPESEFGASFYPILQIGVHVTDEDLNIVDGDGLSFAIWNPQWALDDCCDWSKTHFADTLMKVCSNPRQALKLSAAEARIIMHLTRYGVECGLSPLCGNSVQLDRDFIMHQMPNLSNFLHYRNIDVSSFKEVVKRWYPQTAKLVMKAGSHDALTDIKESIAELRLYRDQCMIKV